ncbi:four helix bundle protein [Candidatus Woesebacteria bacterium]|nr:four helix bundle protein [Candidatus Woesebacteria bacterium]
MNTINDLKIYRKGIDLYYMCYKLIFSYPELSREFAIRDQLKRASLSVPLNIMEGFATSKKRFANFLVIAIGSANETVLLLQIVEDLLDIDTKELREEYMILVRQLQSLRKKLSN